MEEKDRRTEYRDRAYQLQTRINRHKAGSLIDKLPRQPEPVDSGRGTVEDWARMCAMLTRYERGYTDRRPPSTKLINDLTKLRAKIWD